MYQVVSAQMFQPDLTCSVSTPRLRIIRVPDVCSWQEVYVPRSWGVLVWCSLLKGEGGGGVLDSPRASRLCWWLSDMQKSFLPPDMMSLKVASFLKTKHVKGAKTYYNISHDFMTILANNNQHYSYFIRHDRIKQIYDRLSKA